MNKDKMQYFFETALNNLKRNKTITVFRIVLVWIVLLITGVFLLYFNLLNNNSKDIFMNNKQIITGVHYIKIALMFVLMLMTVFLMANGIKMSLVPRKVEFRVMQLVGATDWFISCPVIIEGLITGFIGGLIGDISLIIGYSILYFTFSSDLNITELQEIMKIILILLSYGILISIFASLVSLRKTLKYLNEN